MVELIEGATQQTYGSLLADAVRVLTAAARLSRRLPDGAGGERGEPVDWAEFVTLALAGAAANVGHVEAVLAGRPGSWEADGVRQLLISTVGDDDQLLRHRTEPVVINLYVDEILLDAGAWTAYDKATDELNRQDEALNAVSSEPLASEQKREWDAIGDLADRLEAQRLADWAAYGEALRAHIEGAAARIVDLRVPVVVHVDVDTCRPAAERGEYADFVTLSEEFVEAAVLATPLPGNGIDPLRRLETTAAPVEEEWP